MGEMLYAHAVETAEEWSGAKVGYLDEIPEKENLVRDLANPEGVDPPQRVHEPRERRGRHRVGQAPPAQLRRAAAVLRAQGARTSPSAPQPRGRRAIQRLRSAGPHEARHVAEAPAAARGHRPQPGYRGARARGAVRNGSQPLHELAGLRRRVPHGARFPSPENGELSFDARYCIGCGLCVDACPQQAIELVEATAAVFLPDEDENPEPPID